MKETKNTIVEGKIPSHAAVMLKKQEKLIVQLEETISSQDTSFYKELSKKLIQEFGDTAVVSALLYKINGSGKPEPTKDRYDHDEYKKKSGRSGYGKGGRGSRTLGLGERPSRKDRSFEKN